MTGATAFLDCRGELRTPLSGASSDPWFRCGKIHGLDHWVIKCESLSGEEWEKHATSTCGPRRVFGRGQKIVPFEVTQGLADGRNTRSSRANRASGQRR